MGANTSASCIVCGLGTYQPSTGASACLSCPNGTSTSTLGADKSSLCINSDVACIARGQCYDLNNFQMAYYPFLAANPTQDVSGSLGSLSASSSAPTLTTGPWTSSSGTSSSAAYFPQSGSSCKATGPATSGIQYYSLPSFTLSSALTVCLWYKPSYKYNSAQARLFSFAQTRNLGKYEIAFYEQAPLPTSLPALPDLGAQIEGPNAETYWSAVVGANKYDTTKWTHFCAAVQGSQMKVYFDNVLSSFTLSGALPAGSRSLNYIARSLWDGDCMYTGYIADFRIFNRTLTASEVGVLYNWRGNQALATVAVPN